jgi:hypothetical protein
VRRGTVLPRPSNGGDYFLPSCSRYLRPSLRCPSGDGGSCHVDARPVAEGPTSANALGPIKAPADRTVRRARVGRPLRPLGRSRNAFPGFQRGRRRHPDLPQRVARARHGPRRWDRHTDGAGPRRRRSVVDGHLYTGPVLFHAGRSERHRQPRWQPGPRLYDGQLRDVHGLLCRLGRGDGHDLRHDRRERRSVLGRDRCSRG